jgi:hypothetical protein
MWSGWWLGWVAFLLVLALDIVASLRVGRWAVVTPAQKAGLPSFGSSLCWVQYWHSRRPLKLWVDPLEDNPRVSG